MTPDDFDFSSTRARILHLGLPGAHKAMDRPWRGEANGWVAVLRKAKAAGLAANLELMTTSADRLAELGRPCLPHLDWLIVNDYEIGALAGRGTRRADGSTDPAAVARAIEDVLALGAMRWAAAHFPEGGVVGARDGSRLALGSVAMPASAIVGANGAGDAFAAGMLYGLHEEWPIAECLELGHACAAASMRAVSTTGGVGTVAECHGAGEAMGLPAARAERLRIARSKRAGLDFIIGGESSSRAGVSPSPHLLASRRDGVQRREAAAGTARHPPQRPWA